MTGQEARDDEREARDGVLRIVHHTNDQSAEYPRDADFERVLTDRIVAWMQAKGYRKHPEPEMEYEVTYSSANAPSVDGYALRRTSGVMSDLAKAREFAAVARNPLLRARTKGVPAGPWVPVGEGEQGNG